MAVLLFASLSFSRQDARNGSASDGNYRLVTHEETKYGIRAYYETTYQLFEGNRLRWQILMPNNDWAHWLLDGQVYALSKPVPGPGGGGTFWVRDLLARERVSMGLHQMFSVLSKQNVQLLPGKSHLAKFKNGSELTLSTTEGEKIAITLLQSSSGMGTEYNLVRPVGDKVNDPIGEMLGGGQWVDVYRVDSQLPGQLLQFSNGSERRMIYCTLSPYSQINGKALFIVSQMEVQDEPTNVVQTPGHRTLWFDFGNSPYPNRSNLLVLDEQGQVVAKVDLAKLQNTNENEPARFVDFKTIYLRENGRDTPLSQVTKGKYLSEETLILKDSQGGEFKLQFATSKGQTKFSINYFPISRSGTKSPPAAIGSHLYRSASGRLQAAFEGSTKSGIDLVLYGTMAGSDAQPITAELYRRPVSVMPSSAIVSESGKVWFTFAKDHRFLALATPGTRQIISFELHGHDDFELEDEARGLDLARASFEYEGEGEAFNLNRFPIKRYPKESISLPGIKGRAKQLIIERMSHMPAEMDMPIIKLGG